MKIKLSDHFNYRRLFRFVLPSVIMMIFTSVYGVVDGLFVSNYVGKTEFAAVNLIWPFVMLLSAFGFMIGTGGSAVVAISLGQGKKKEANEIFSMLVKVTVIIGSILALLGIIFTEKIAIALGATDNLLAPCVTYGRILLLSLVPFMLQNVFQSFLVTAERPNLGLIVTIAAGVTNMLLDFILIGVLRGGVVGAACATAASQLVGGCIPLIYFIRKNTSLLHIVPAKINFSILGKTCFNGSSELMTNVSVSLVNMLFNLQLMKYAGENGVAAYGVIMYVNFVFISIFIGYSIGTAPIIGYNYGAGNGKELKNVFKKSIIFNVLAGISMYVLAYLLSGFLSGIFVGYDDALYELTKNGFRIYSMAFLFIGLNIYGSSFFTAVGDGVLSAILSFLRTLLFQVATLLLLPLIFGLNGIWMSIVVAELIAIVVTIGLLVAKRKKYISF